MLWINQIFVKPTRVFCSYRGIKPAFGRNENLATFTAYSNLCSKVTIASNKNVKKWEMHKNGIINQWNIESSKSRLKWNMNVVLGHIYSSKHSVQAFIDLVSKSCNKVDFSFYFSFIIIVLSWNSVCAEGFKINSLRFTSIGVNA